MTSVSKRKLLISSSIISLVIILDQTTKILAQSYFGYVCNQGIAFGIKLGNSSLGFERFFVIAVVILLAIIFAGFVCEGQNLRKLSLAFILGGGVSNLLDRILFGCVRDFLNFGLISSFNLADSTIMIGVLVMIYSLVKRKL